MFSGATRRRTLAGGLDFRSPWSASWVGKFIHQSPNFVYNSSQLKILLLMYLVVIFRVKRGRLNLAGRKRILGVSAFIWWNLVFWKPQYMLIITSFQRYLCFRAFPKCKYIPISIKTTSSFWTRQLSPDVTTLMLNLQYLFIIDIGLVPKDIYFRLQRKKRVRYHAYHMGNSWGSTPDDLLIFYKY